MRRAEPAPEPSGGDFGRSPLILPGDPKLRGKRLLSRRGLFVLLPAFLALPMSIAIALMLPSASTPPVRTGEIHIEELTPSQRHAELGIEPIQPVTSAKPRLSARTHAVPSSRHNPGVSALLPCRRRSC